MRRLRSALMGKIVRWFAIWLVHIGLWLIYVSKLDKWEIIVGAAAAGLATLGLGVFRRLGLVKCRPRLKELAEAWRLPWDITYGTWQLIEAIGKQLFWRTGVPSSLVAVPFDVGPDSPACAGRRALAVFYTTVTPNSVVVGIVREQGLLLWHQIIPRDVPPLTRNLGARP